MDVNTGAKPGGICEMLCQSVNSVVTIYTEACCFTGLLCSVHCGVVKLVTRYNHGCPGYSCYGKVTAIPICEIIAVTLCNTGA